MCIATAMEDLKYFVLKLWFVAMHFSLFIKRYNWFSSSQEGFCIHIKLSYAIYVCKILSAGLNTGKFSYHLLLRYTQGQNCECKNT